MSRAQARGSGRSADPGSVRTRGPAELAGSAGPAEPDAPATRRPRRAHAPATNPGADQTDDLPARRTGRADDLPARRPPRPATGIKGLDARDAWILDQRPPHWD